MFNQYPYLNEQDLNLDYILQRMKNLEETVAQFVALETVTFADPIKWTIASQYPKSTIVLDNAGNAYVSKKSVPAGVQLSNTDYWLEIFNFTAYIKAFDSNLTYNIEANTDRASKAYIVGDWLLLDDILYKVIAAISADELFVIDTNIEHFTVEEFIKAWIQYANGLIVQYKNDIDASELAYRNQLAGDIAATTESLQAQLDLAISGATVDSEVINARLGADGITYNTLGDAIRTQITNTNSNADNNTNIIVDVQNEGIVYPDLDYVNKYIDSSTGQLPASTVSTRASTKMVYIPVNASPSVEIDTSAYTIQLMANYDMNGAYIGAGYGGDSTAIDPDARYIRMCISKRNSSANISTTEAANVKIKLVCNGAFGNPVNKQITDLHEEVTDNTIDIAELQNKSYLYPDLDYVNRAIDTSTGELTASVQPTRASTKKLYLPPNADASILIDTSLYLIQVMANYDINGDYIGAGYGGDITAIDPDARYIRMCISMRNTSANIDVDDATRDVKIKFVCTTNSLYGKVGLSIGDSILSGSGNNGVGILDIMHDLYGIEVHDYSVGGACIEDIEGKSHINDQLTSAISDSVAPDFVLFDGISNDLVYGTLGTMTSGFDYGNMSWNTFSEALEKQIGLLIAQYPTVPIIYVLPHESRARSYADELAFGDRAREICKKWSIPIADIYKEGGMTSRVTSQLQTLTFYPDESSGTHPNQAGYELKYIPTIMRMLKPYFN